jgi:hypothetical protein
VGDSPDGCSVLEFAEEMLADGAGEVGVDVTNRVPGEGVEFVRSPLRIRKQPMGRKASPSVPKMR